MTESPVSRKAVDRPPPAEDVIAVQERRRAARALLLRPLLAAVDDEFALVRRHRDELVRLFADGLGYRLVVEPTVARLFKAGLGRDPGRGLRRRNGRPFTPRAYSLLCLTIAALTRCRAQLLVDELVAEVRSAAADASIDVDLDAVTDRRALHAALLALVDLGVLVERDGDLEHWADRSTAALIDVRRERLALLVAAPLGSAEGPDELLDQAALPSAAGGARVVSRRRLAESPVLSVTDLTDEQQEWWRRNRNRERLWFHDQLGLEVELRAEGAVAVDPDEELTDRAFPGAGSARHLALLWLERVITAERDEARSADLTDRVWRRVPADMVNRAFVEVTGQWVAGLRRAHRDDPTLAKVDAQDVLVGSGLVRTDIGGWQVHAACARYAPRPVLAASGESGEASLFDDEDDT